ncbi:MAG: sensor histidine kinase, partial [Bacteroidota bacterium]
DNLEKAYYKYYNLIFSFQYFKKGDWNPSNSKYLLQFVKTSKFHYLNAQIYQLHGVYEHILGKNEQAIRFEEFALKELDKISYPYKSTLLKNSFYALTRYHIYNDSPKKAEQFLELVKGGAKNRFEKENHKYFFFYQSMLDSINKDFSSAFKNLMEYTSQNNVYTVLKNQNAYNELEAKYQTAEKERQILEEQKKVRANRNWLIAATLALLLGAGIAILLQKNTTKKRQLAEQEVQLKQQRVENLLKEQELVSIDAMIAGQEKERQKVANELHDDLGSLMATIKLHFENVPVSKKDPALKNAQKLLEQAYQKIRGMAHHKNSGVMSDQGLLPAVKKMAQTINETNTLQVTVADFGLGERLENALELTIFRMVQELVANIIKHADATTAHIQFTQHEAQLNIIVEDNGKGFDSASVESNQNGMGLTTIEKRVEHLEGSFTIDSVLGKGTSILIDIPV